MTELMVEPELQDALDRAKDTVNKIIETSSNPAESIKEIQHMGSEMAGLYKDVNWMRVNANLFNPSLYQSQLEELIELQKSTIESLVKQQESLIHDTTESGRALLEGKNDITKPQAVMARVINQSLDNYDKFSTCMREQASTLGKMQTSYFDWCRKTLTDLSKPLS
ncbi:hypothetical protein [Halioxenophilus aromaticivorans]|uniref:Phasin domain-containing protein n=1 Tax=Halioxenophilus aromaticivorans TaxID=1306992 RepID=A0AAV3TY70_9ALTE